MTNTTEHRRTRVRRRSRVHWNPPVTFAHLSDAKQFMCARDDRNWVSKGKPIPIPDGISVQIFRCCQVKNRRCPALMRLTITECGAVDVQEHDDHRHAGLRSTQGLRGGVRRIIRRLVTSPSVSVSDVVREVKKSVYTPTRGQVRSAVAHMKRRAEPVTNTYLGLRDIIQGASALLGQRGVSEQDRLIYKIGSLDDKGISLIHSYQQGRYESIPHDGAVVDSYVTRGIPCR